jgi:uncharacterized protein (TIGR03435 family)
MPRAVVLSLIAPVVLLARTADQSGGPRSSGTPPTFEAASLRLNKSGTEPFRIVPLPGRLRGTNVPAKFLIAAAFAEDGAPLHNSRIVGGPGWLDSTRFDLEATAGANVPAPVLFTMLRSLLVEQWKLVTHQEQREMPIYALVLAGRSGEPGPHLRRSTTDCDALMAQIRNGVPSSSSARRLYRAGVDSITGSCARIPMLATSLSQSPSVGRRVEDRTGLDGWFDVDLTWALDQPLAGQFPDGRAPVASDVPGLFTALQEQLGLKLESTRAPADVLVIDNAELRANH